MIMMMKAIDNLLEELLEVEVDLMMIETIISLNIEESLSDNRNLKNSTIRMIIGKLMINDTTLVIPEMIM